MTFYGYCWIYSSLTMCIMSLQSFPIIFPFLYFVLPWIHFYDSSLSTLYSYNCEPRNIRLSRLSAVSQVPAEGRNPRRDKTKPQFKFKAYDRLRFYFNAPVTKFHYSMVGIAYTVFLHGAFGLHGNCINVNPVLKIVYRYLWLWHQLYN